MICLPRPGEVMRPTTVLREHPRWSAFWDKRYRVWRVSEDDPHSDLYAESADVDQVISYVMPAKRDLDPGASPLHSSAPRCGGPARRPA